MGVGAKTVLPARAHAKLSMRLVPDQDPSEIGRLVEQYLTQLAPPAVTLAVRRLHSGPGAIVRRDGPAMRAAADAYAVVFGRHPFFVREGGSIPVVALLQSVLGIDSVLMGFGLPDERAHAPNEKLHLPNFYRGIQTAIHFMTNLAQST